MQALLPGGARACPPGAACSPSPVLHVNRVQPANVILHCIRLDSSLTRRLRTPAGAVGVSSHVQKPVYCMCVVLLCVRLCVCVCVCEPVAQCPGSCHEVSHKDRNIPCTTYCAPYPPSGGLFLQSVSDASESTTTAGCSPLQLQLLPAQPGLPLLGPEPSALFLLLSMHTSHIVHVDYPAPAPTIGNSHLRDHLISDCIVRT